MRYKNISANPLDLRDRDGSLIRTLAPGEIVEGDYSQFLPGNNDGIYPQVGPLKCLDHPPRAEQIEQRHSREWATAKIRRRKENDSG